jgi:hypothetical protein
MEIDYSRYELALRRNLAELSNAILKRRALVGMHDANSVHGLDFFRVASHALYNDILAHTMRAFDRSGQSAAFWYILKVDPPATALAAKDIDLKRIEAISDRFKIIRDKTHFHIDRDSLANPSTLWSDAAITGDDLGYLLESGFHILSTLYHTRTGMRIDIPDYDGRDVIAIMKAYKKCHPAADLTI